MSRQKILLITADQWRGEALSSLGHRVQTPNLDALAGEGALFTRHYANAVPCAPSRASLHTGMYLQNHRACTNGTPLDARHDNWARVLRNAGHDPVLFGYTDTANDPRAFAPDDPILKSYEGPLPGIRPVVQMGTFPDAWADWLAEQGLEVPDPNWRFYTEKASGTEYEDGGEHPLPLAIPAEQHDTWFMVDQVIDFIRGSSDRFCVHLSLLRPHPPWVAPAPYNEMYPPGELEDFVRADSPGDEGQQHPWLEWMLRGRRTCAPADVKKLTRLKASYFGLMSEVDANLGRLFEFLKSAGHWDDTLVIFTSDHGEQIGDHWLVGKMGYFDQSYHIPLIIRDPLVPSSHGKRFDRFTENVDIMPTMLEWTHATIPEQCDGMSLLAPLRDGDFPANWRTEAHWEYDFRNITEGEPMEDHLGLTTHQCTLNVIRSETHKYVHFTNLPPLLFDLEADPGEFNNLANDPAHAQTVLHYAQKMLSWRMNHDEQTLTHLTLTEDGVQARRAPRY